MKARLAGYVALFGCTVCCGGSSDEAPHANQGNGSPGPALDLPTSSSTGELRICGRYGLGKATSVALSPDAETLVVGGPDALLSFRTSDATLLRRFEVEGDVGGVAFSPNGRELAVDVAGKVNLIELSSGEVKSTLEGPSPGSIIPLDLRYTSDGAALTVGGVDRINVHRLPSAEMMASLPGEFAWSVDRITATEQDAILVRSAAGVAALDLATNSLSPIRSIATRWMGGIASGPDGLVATGDDSGSIQVWRQGETDTLFTCKVPGKIQSLAFSRDGSRLAVVSTDAEAVLYVFEVGKTEPLFTHQLSSFLGDLEYGSQVRFGKASDQLFAHDAYRGVSVKAPDGALTGKYGWGHTAWFEDAAISPDQHWIASSARDGVIVWERDSTIRSRVDDLTSPSPVAFSADSRRLYVADFATLVEVDPETGARVAESEQLYTSMIDEMVVSPDGASILAGVFFHALVMVSSETLNPLYTIPVSGSYTSRLAFSSDSSAFVASKANNDLTVWDTATGNELKSISLPGELGPLRFLPGGRRLVAASGSDVLVFEWPSLLRLQTLSRHQAPVYELVQFGDERHVASLGRDEQRVILWDVMDGRVISEGKADAGGVPRIALPEGLEFSVLLQRGSALRNYCNRADAPLSYLEPLL